MTVEEWPFRLLACVGFFTIAVLAWVTGRRSRLTWTTIGGSAVLAWGLGIVSFWFPGSRWLWSIINEMVVAVLTASQKGTVFLLGPLALGPGQTLQDGTVSIGFILAAQALPAVVFFAALMAGLYYLGVMQAIVGLFARLFYRTMGLSGAESLSGAANIFVGIEAASITVAPSYARIGPTFFPWIVGSGLFVIGGVLAWLVWTGAWAADADEKAEAPDLRALAFIAAGLALVSGYQARLAATLHAAMMGSSAVLVHLPRVIANPEKHEEWIMLAVSSGLAGSAVLIRKHAT